MARWRATMSERSGPPEGGPSRFTYKSVALIT